MTETEQYTFDLNGYLVIPQLLATDETASLAKAAEVLTEHAEDHLEDPPRVTALRGVDYHRDEELGYHVSCNWRSDDDTAKEVNGRSLLIEDFFNANSAFDCLVNHARTQPYVTALISERPAINNSELRVRYPGNLSGTHMGGPLGAKYRYRFYDGRMDCMMIRVIYFLHDVSTDQGAFCVVPGTHKSNFASPYHCAPHEEPDMVPLEVKAGDAILFTENLRHGGVPNLSEQVRKTLHVGYGPYWLKSQNIATMDQDPYILEQTLDRYDDAQKHLFHTYELPKRILTRAR
jgi:hypothetical protein